MIKLSTVVGIVGCVTRPGRQRFARELLKEKVTVKTVIDEVTAVVESKVDDLSGALCGSARLRLAHRVLTHLHSLTGILLRVTDPSSDGGVTVTEQERKDLSASLNECVSGLVTDEVVSRVRDAIVRRVP